MHESSDAPAPSLGSSRAQSAASQTTASGSSAVECSHADEDGWYRADTGHYSMSEHGCFTITVLHELPIE